MLKSLAAQLVLGLVVVLQLSSYADARHRDRNNGGRNDYPSTARETGSEEAMRNDRDLAGAVEGHVNRRQFLEGGNMEVVKVLPDDNNGLKHQSWIVRLSNGRELRAVYNVDMCERVPVRVGDRVAMGGEFIWTKYGGLLHWLHHDPRGQRPDGYVYLNGKFYCKE